MLDILKQPYPYLHKGHELYRNTVFLLVLAFSFEYLLEPFNVARSEHNFDYWIIVGFHASNATIIYLCYFSLLSVFAQEDDWKIYKEALTLLCLLLLIGSGSFLLREVIYDNPNNVSWGYYFEEVKNTILVGSIIMFIMISFNFRIARRRNQDSANVLEKPTMNSSTSNQPIRIEAAVASDHFDVDPNEIVCIKSDGNYLEFYLKQGEQADRVIKRLTLQSAMDQLQGSPFIFKTHRAFLVNTRYINKVEGNAQGYQLSLSHLTFQIPVSRKHLLGFNELMR